VNTAGLARARNRKIVIRFPPVIKCICSMKCRGTPVKIAWSYSYDPLYAFVAYTGTIYSLKFNKTWSVQSYELCYKL